jgi:predicted nucleotide-binding protein
MKKAVQLFLTRANLKDIVLHEQPDKNRTVIEKLIEEGNSAAYVIALLSPDDTQEDGTVRARQNVVLEIGYFIGRLGREKVRLLRKGEVVIPSDLQGILFENYDNEGAWRIKLLKEMQAAGLPIDLVAHTD